MAVPQGRALSWGCTPWHSAAYPGLVPSRRAWSSSSYFLLLTPLTTYYHSLLTTTHYLLPLTTYQASVVFLFLLPGLNARLRPTLAAQLRPGARVLSAEFQVSSRPDMHLVSACTCTCTCHMCMSHAHAHVHAHVSPCACPCIHSSARLAVRHEPTYYYSPHPLTTLTTPTYCLPLTTYHLLTTARAELLTYLLTYLLGARLAVRHEPAHRRRDLP